MIKLSEKSRRVLRMIYRGLGASAISSFLFPACNWFPAPEYGMPVMYGMPPYLSEDLLLRGQVKSQKTGAPIPGIGIWIKDITSSYVNLTDTDGSFYIYVPKQQDNYTVVFTDIDGGENGGRFKQHTIYLTTEECEALAESPLIIELEEVDG